MAAALRYKYPAQTLFLDSLYAPLELIEEIPLERRRRARAVTGHLHYGVHRHMPQTCEYITMLRDPVARVVSHVSPHPRQSAATGSTMRSRARGWRSRTS